MLLVRAILILLTLFPLTVRADTEPVITGVAVDGTLMTARSGALRLAHIRFPAAIGDRYADLQHAAIADLSHFLEDGAPQVQALGADRWGRPLVAVGAEGRTMQEALLRAGLAVVDMRAGLETVPAALYEAEAAARRAGRGLWAAGLRVYGAGEAMPDNGYGIVQGRIVDVAKVGGRIYVNFGADYRTDFTVLLEDDVSRAMQDWTPPVTDMAGYRVRVRGMLEDWNGPLLRLAGQQDMEILSAPEGDPKP